MFREFLQNIDFDSLIFQYLSRSLKGQLSLLVQVGGHLREVILLPVDLDLLGDLLDGLAPVFLDLLLLGRHHQDPVGCQLHVEVFLVEARHVERNGEWWLLDSFLNDWNLDHVFLRQYLHQGNLANFFLGLGRFWNFLDLFGSVLRFQANDFYSSVIADVRYSVALRILSEINKLYRTTLIHFFLVLLVDLLLLGSDNLQLTFTVQPSSDLIDLAILGQGDRVEERFHRPVPRVVTSHLDSLAGVVDLDGDVLRAISGDVHDGLVLVLLLLETEAGTPLILLILLLLAEYLVVHLQRGGKDLTSKVDAVGKDVNVVGDVSRDEEVVVAAHVSPVEEGHGVAVGNHLVL